MIDGISLPISGAVYVNTALFFAYALYNPDAMVRINFIIPIRMKWVAWFEAALYAVSVIRYAMSGLWGMALMPIVALLNLFVFFAPMFQRKAAQVKSHSRPQAVQFRKAVREQQKQRGLQPQVLRLREDGRGLSGHAGFATAPSARATTATARITSSTTYILPSENRRRARTRRSGRGIFRLAGRTTA